MKKLLLLAVLSGAAVFSGTAVMTGCSAGDGTGGGGGGSGGGTGGGGGSGGKTLCSDDSQCAMGHICDPGAKVCVQSCTVGSDCTDDTNSSCGTTIVAGGTTSVCHCATDGTCNMAFPGTICASIDQVCTKKCSTSSECATGRDCDSNGDCVMQAVDSGTPCTGLDQCGSDVCNFTTGQCESPASCNMASAQPDVCGYAGYCSSASTCSQIGVPACAGAQADALVVAFNPATSTGPIIYFPETDPSPNAAVCFKGFFVHSFYLDAYRTDQNWPGTLGAAPGFKYIRSDGSELDGTMGIPGSYYVANGKTLRLRWYGCAQTQGALDFAWYFTGGNAACGTSSGAVAGSTACTTNAQCAPLTCDMGTGICG